MMRARVVMSCFFGTFAALSACTHAADSVATNDAGVDAAPVVIADAAEDAEHSADAAVDVEPFDAGYWSTCLFPLEHECPDGGHCPKNTNDIRLDEVCPRAYGLGQTCAGMVALSVNYGTDCASIYLFDAVSRDLVAVANVCSGPIVCTGGNPGFAFPLFCFTEEHNFGWGGICTGYDAGHPDAAAVDASDANVPDDAQSEGG